MQIFVFAFIVFTCLFSHLLVLLATNPVSAGVAASSTYSSLFRILAVIPNDKAPQISRELRQAVNQWQFVNHHEISVEKRHSRVNIPIQAHQPGYEENSLILTPIPIGNDTERLVDAMCELIEVHKPSLIFSMLDATKTYYLQMITKNGDVPLLTLSSEYKETSLFDSKNQVSFSYSSVFNHYLTYAFNSIQFTYSH
ncbi:hypothetical protein B4U80_03289 [Leptotrombidium deliense]|uniref:Uncharacterized protein n=1 Tax=Leptotrombidium deliense TaxID=299467 RepID=A0A443SG24_9ACAR|nr:hypothetical protein B4U80_03289 [Leptotrombidium deliense]